MIVPGAWMLCLDKWCKSYLLERPMGKQNRCVDHRTSGNALAPSFLSGVDENSHQVLFRRKKCEHQSQPILRPFLNCVDLMKVLNLKYETAWAGSPMTHLPPNRFFTIAALSSIVLAMGIGILVSSQYAESKKWYAAALRNENVSRLLEADRQSLVQQSTIKRATVEDLSAGRITLREATSRFLALDEDWPRIHAHVHSVFAGNSDSEREARCVVLMACNYALSPTERRTLFERLVAEFALLFPTAAQISLTAHNDAIVRVDVR
jgi:hypothetical protein